MATLTALDIPHRNFVAITGAPRLLADLARVAVDQKSLENGLADLAGRCPFEELHLDHNARLDEPDGGPSRRPVEGAIFLLKTGEQVLQHNQGPPTYPHFDSTGIPKSALVVMIAKYEAAKPSSGPGLVRTPPTNEELLPMPVLILDPRGASLAWLIN
jgi:hypothetical protein